MKKVIVKFWGDGCMNCNVMNPIVDGLKSQYPNIEFRDINASRDDEAAAKYGVTTLPTLIFEADGVEVGRLVGLRPKTLIIKKIVEVFG